MYCSCKMCVRYCSMRSYHSVAARGHILKIYGHVGPRG
ncbi:Protein of unknown function [Pyronema omphalodes CBS 100304]|uniref:Uncharacterized protein n=1 Tax=Pyronema omphalodes (strain CBS 100304) TaxID=1076935 RepID=U4KZD2_PYROM|nr:Protein of unknown function [Pyronema omphalodes CBS 100304]